TVGRIDAQLRLIDEPVAAIDIAGVGRIDTVGAWAAWSLAQRLDAELVGAGSEAQRLIEAVSRAGHQTTTVSRHRLPMLLRVPAHVGDSMAGL
ncbi:hypothetical protein ABTN15_19200, partial [Acinetobacter baumannii]